MKDLHEPPSNPSSWVTRFVSLIPPGLPVLDVACGNGRHTRFLLRCGYVVVAVDRDLSPIKDLLDDPHLTAIETDLEEGTPLPFLGEKFAGVVVTNYLFRPILDTLVELIACPGALIYETFAAGNERFGRPTRPDFLLQREELLELVRGRLRVVAFEDVVVHEPRLAAVQRIAAIRD